MLRLVTGLVALVLAFPSATQAPAARMKLGEVLLFTSAGPAPPPAATRSEPGITGRLFQADRGSRKGQYALVWSVDTLRRRNDRAAFLDDAAKGGVEYHLVAPEKAGMLPEVEVLGLHYTKVPPDRTAAFERFVGEQLHPSVGHLRPDLSILYYKAVRGADPGSYLALFALTKASRDKYWPGGSDSDDLRAAFQPLQEITNELRTYLVAGSFLADPTFAAAVYESREWADFVLVSANVRPPLEPSRLP